jgi:hypothetical protein
MLSTVNFREARGKYQRPCGSSELRLPTSVQVRHKASLPSSLPKIPEPALLRGVLDDTVHRDKAAVFAERSVPGVQGTVAKHTRLVFRLTC